jgi:hypothetical protein
MTGPETPEDDHNVITLGWRVYQQIAAIIGSFALIVFIGDLAHLDWRGFLGTLIGAWDEYVRPPVKWLLNLLVSIPLGWFGWHVQVPQWLRDYLAVGLVFSASMLRLLATRGDSWRETLKDFMTVDEPWQIVVWPPFVLLLWPVTFLWFILSVVSGLIIRDSYVWNAVLIISPLLYGAVLLAVNFLVLR